MHSQQIESASRLHFMLRAFRYRNYRLFFGGQIVSLIGTWLTIVASSWLVYQLSGASGKQAALMLGLIGFAGQIPMFLCSPIAGVLVDRWNRHRILLATQTLSMLQSFALAVLALGGWINIEWLIILNTFQGVVNALDVPARQAFTVEMVEDRDDLSNAIALNSSMMHGSRLVGPAVAGYLIYVVGEGYCFLIDGVSYLAVIGSLLAMRLGASPRGRTRQHPIEALREGFGYAFGFRPIRTLLLMVGVTSFVAMSQSTLMPIFAAQVLGGAERTLGFLLGATGVGAFTGALYLASRRSVLGLGRVIATACGLLGVGLIGVASSRSLLLTMPLLSLVGFSMVVQVAASNTVIQTIVHDDKRGRMMALFSMAFLGMAPFGSLTGGAVASQIGAPATVGLAGCVCLVTAGVFATRLRYIRPLIRPIYETKGILPAVAVAIQDTASITPTAPE